MIITGDKSQFFSAFFSAVRHILRKIMKDYGKNFLGLTWSVICRPLGGQGNSFKRTDGHKRKTTRNVP